MCLNRQQVLVPKLRCLTKIQKQKISKVVFGANVNAGTMCSAVLFVFCVILLFYSAIVSTESFTMVRQSDERHESLMESLMERHNSDMESLMERHNSDMESRFADMERMRLEDRSKLEEQVINILQLQSQVANLTKINEEQAIEILQLQSQVTNLTKINEELLAANAEFMKTNKELRAANMKPCPPCPPCPTLAGVFRDVFKKRRKRSKV